MVILIALSVKPAFSPGVCTPSGPGARRAGRSSR